MEQEISMMDEQIKKLGLDPAQVKIETSKNLILKCQKETLEASLKWQKKRNSSLKLIPSNMIDLAKSIVDSINELKKSFGKDVDL